MHLFRRLFNKIELRKKRPVEDQISDFFTPEKINRLEKLIGCKVKDKKIYLQAFIHRSFLEENDKLDTSNERIEFLGDSVLNLVIGEFLYKEFPEEEEGFLTKVRAKMVNKNALSAAAETIKLDEFILFGKNLSKTVINNSKSILADALEAVIGAVYLDAGLQDAKNFITNVIINPILEEGEHLVDENYKSQLLEYAQAEKLSNPLYEVIKEEGPQHERVFTIKVSVNKKFYGIGSGKTKKTAEQIAAKRALEKIRLSQNSDNTK